MFVEPTYLNVFTPFSFAKETRVIQILFQTVGRRFILSIKQVLINQIYRGDQMSSTGSQGLEVSCELCEEILAVGVAGEAGQALLDQHVGGLDKGRR